MSRFHGGAFESKYQSVCIVSSAWIKALFRSLERERDGLLSFVA